MLAVAVVDPHFPLCGVCAGKYIQLISVVISTAGPAKIDTHYSYRYWGMIVGKYFWLVFSHNTLGNRK